MPNCREIRACVAQVAYLGRMPDWLAGDAVLIAPRLSGRIPCKQGILQGIVDFRAPDTKNLAAKLCSAAPFRPIPCANREFYFANRVLS
jgi:hypothetical protein